MLAHSVVNAAPSSRPERAMLFVHGILGTKANWRAIARRFVKAKPTWSAVLVDLREHGDSLGLDRPHTLRAAGEDLKELEDGLPLPVGGALGHSFGGKVVLEWLRSRQNQPTKAWLVDSSPSPADADHDTTATAAVIRTLEALPRRWASREAFIAAVVEAGQPEAISAWLAMNLQRTDDGGRIFGPDLTVIRELITDYARVDCWDVVESLPPISTLDVVIGDDSSVFSRLDRDRLGELARLKPNVSAHLVEAAGHWVHVDAPDALVALLTGVS